MLDEAISEAAISDLREKRIAIALSDLKAFLECLTDDTRFDECNAVRLADDTGILVVLESDSDKLMYSLTVDEFLQAHTGKVEWTRLLGQIGEWVRDALEHYSCVRRRQLQTFSYEASEAEGMADEIARLGANTIEPTSP